MLTAEPTVVALCRAPGCSVAWVSRNSSTIPDGGHRRPADARSSACARLVLSAALPAGAFTSRRSPPAPGRSAGSRDVMFQSDWRNGADLENSRGSCADPGRSGTPPGLRGAAVQHAGVRRRQPGGRPGPRLGSVSKLWPASIGPPAGRWPGRDMNPPAPRERLVGQAHAGAGAGDDLVRPPAMPQSRPRPRKTIGDALARHSLLDRLGRLDAAWRYSKDASVRSTTASG